MAYSKFTGIGKVIRVGAPKFDTKKSCLEVVMNIPTGEQKKDGDEYAPSNLVRFLLWDKAADALMPYISQGSKLLVDGQLGVSNVYENRATLSLNYVTVQLLDNQEQPSNSQVKSKNITSSKSKAQDDFPDDNFSDDGDSDLFD